MATDTTKEILKGHRISAFGGELTISETPGFNGISVAIDDEYGTHTVVIIHKLGVETLQRALNELRVSPQGK